MVPSQPLPPTLEHASVNTLSLGWPKRPTDDTYTLQMEDSLNGYGFRPVHNGKETRFVCQDLRRNTYYRFRVSDVMCSNIIVSYFKCDLLHSLKYCNVYSMLLLL